MDKKEALIEILKGSPITRTDLSNFDYVYYDENVNSFIVRKDGETFYSNRMELNARYGISFISKRNVEIFEIKNDDKNDSVLIKDKDKENSIKWQIFKYAQFYKLKKYDCENCKLFKKCGEKGNPDICEHGVPDNLSQRELLEIYDLIKEDK